MTKTMSNNNRGFKALISLMAVSALFVFSACMENENTISPGEDRPAPAGNIYEVGVMEFKVANTYSFNHECPTALNRSRVWPTCPEAWGKFENQGIPLKPGSKEDKNLSKRGDFWFTNNSYDVKGPMMYRGVHNGEAVWEFIQPSDERLISFQNGAYYDATRTYVCPTCGKSQWISYSNNGSAPSGKNIQLICWEEPVGELLNFGVEHHLFVKYWNIQHKPVISELKKPNGSEFTTIVTHSDRKAQGHMTYIEAVEGNTKYYLAESNPANDKVSNCDNFYYTLEKEGNKWFVVFSPAITYIYAGAVSANAFSGNNATFNGNPTSFVKHVEHTREPHEQPLRMEVVANASSGNTTLSGDDYIFVHIQAGVINNKSQAIQYISGCEFKKKDAIENTKYNSSSHGPASIVVRVYEYNNETQGEEIIGNGKQFSVTLLQSYLVVVEVDGEPKASSVVYADDNLGTVSFNKVFVKWLDCELNCSIPANCGDKAKSNGSEVGCLTTCVCK